MPRSGNPLKKNRFRHSRAPVSKPKSSHKGHKCFFVTMSRLSESKPYMENFYKRRSSCSFVEYYTVPDAASGTYDLYGYLQLTTSATVPELISYFNCRTTLKSTTIAEKLESPFHLSCSYNKVTLGTERVSVPCSLWASGYNASTLLSNDLSVEFPDSSCSPTVL